MKKVIKRMIPVAAFCLILFSVSFAWFRNNQQTAVSSSDSIQIKGNGMMVTAYATGSDGKEITASAAEYGVALPMNLDGKYMNVSGNGCKLFAATFSGNGEPKENGWSQAEADSAVCDGDSGQYVVADVYFKSDMPMDIYLLGESSISPKTDGNDLANTGSYSGYTKFSEFTNGLPALNINQSSYGLFSRNLIAGASRVSFTDYSYDNGEWVLPDHPNVVWVPNSTYQLIKQTDMDKLYSVVLNGAREETYQYYNGTDISSVDRLPEEMGKQLTGILYIKKTDDSDWELITNKTVDHDQMVPSRTVDNYVYPIPQIWLTDRFADAAYSESLGCYVEAEYDPSYSLTSGFAYAASYNNMEIRVMENPNGTGYVKAELNNGKWIETETKYTTAEQIESIENSFKKDTAQYQVTNWMEDSDMNVLTEDQCYISRYKIGSTDSIDNGGSYYARIRIAVWVEGYDREADIALNSGEYNINLKFYGRKK